MALQRLVTCSLSFLLFSLRQRERECGGGVEPPCEPEQEEAAIESEWTDEPPGAISLSQATSVPLHSTNGLLSALIQSRHSKPHSGRDTFCLSWLVLLNLTQWFLLKQLNPFGNNHLRSTLSFQFTPCPPWRWQRYCYLLQWAVCFHTSKGLMSKSTSRQHWIEMK